ncbi:hypothetical protein ACH4SP_20175 [Streptomyces sp. NPDC021093]|uniref:hypothetical protein n=1 Tax=Streptomyces sp. NPDC021093 TaxID=3365112 RepID=UPI0037A415EC
MGAMRRIRHRRTLAAIGVAGAAVAGVVACEPGTAGGLSSFAVALTTDQTGTSALQRAGVAVNWMTCTATVGENGRVTAGPGRGDADRVTAGPDSRPSRVTSAPPVRNVATVACEGQDRDGREIRIAGKVTDERDGRCVRGDLTAKVSGRTVFRVSVLGNCNAPTTGPTSEPPTGPGPTTGPTHRPTWKPTRPTGNPDPTPPVGRTTITVAPPEPDPTPDPRPTVTVTVTAPPDPAPDPPPDPTPTCGCPSDK